MKKLVTLILATILCLTLVSAMAAELPFKDVAKDIWYYDAVQTAYDLGLINGKGSTDTYQPDAEMTYAEAIKLAACMNQLHTTGSVTLANGTVNWYDTYVEYCKTNNIIKKDYNFNDKATRAGYMEIFANALPDAALDKINDIADNFIPDVKMDAEYAPSVYKLYRAGIVAGVDEKFSCNPTANIKRSEVAVILTRMMSKDKRVTIKVPEQELDAGTLSAEDQKIYNRRKSTMEKIAKSVAETAAVETIPNSYSYSMNSLKVTKADSYFRYVVGMSITNVSVSGTDEYYFEVLIRVSTDESYEIGKVSTKVSNDDMKAFGWGTRPADFGAEPEE